MSFALGVVPVVLLLLGFPIFIVLLASVSVALVFFMHMPFAALASEHVRIDQCLCAAGDPVFRLCRRTDGARQRRPAPGRFRAGRRRLGARQPRRHHGRYFGDIRRDLRHQRGLRRNNRPHHVSGDAARRLSGILLRRPGHRGRRDRHHHPAQYSDDRLWRDGRGIGAAALCGGRGAGADVDVHARGLCHVVRPPPRHRRRRGIQARSFPACDHPRHLGARHAVHHSRRHLWRRVLADRGGGGRLRLCRLRHPLCFSRARLARYRRGRLRHRAVLGADSHYRRLRRRFLLAADRQSGSRGDRRLAAIAATFPPGCSC